MLGQWSSELRLMHIICNIWLGKYHIGTYCSVTIQCISFAVHQLHAFLFYFVQRTTQNWQRSQAFHTFHHKVFVYLLVSFQNSQQQDFLKEGSSGLTRTVLQTETGYLSLTAQITTLRIQMPCIPIAPLFQRAQSPFMSNPLMEASQSGLRNSQQVGVTLPSQPTKGCI